jgi:hypothetical protein
MEIAFLQFLQNKRPVPHSVLNSVLLSIEISQENIHGETVMYNVKIDGTTKHSVKNTKVQVFDQVKLYLSSPWSKTFGPYGEVRNIEVVNGKPN